MDISQILKNREIEAIGDIKFTSPRDQLEFLSRFEEIQKKGIILNYVNQDLVNIIKEIEINDTTINKLRKTNWEDFRNLFENHKEKRDEKIYNNFINFLKAELGILRKDTSIHNKNLIGKPENNGPNIDLDLFKMREHFNAEFDKKEKLQRYKIGLKFDYTEPSKKLTVNDFILYFNKRLQYFTELLKNRVNIENMVRISKAKESVKDNTGEVLSIIGLVTDISQTKNGHTVITLEDKTGQIKCFVNKEKPDLKEKLKNLCLDEGIAILGKAGKELIWVDDIIIPSPPNSSELTKTENEHYIAFISDIHFAAKEFVDEAFQKLIEFMNGETNNPELNEISKKIKYVICAGDIIDGIGIYPNQGKNSRILSTEMHYHEAARWLSQIPKDKCLIIIPGNHDSDRLSEPQPKLPYHKAYALYNMENAVLLSNPSIVRLFEDDPSGGVELFMYHGGSIFYYADKIQHLREKGGARVPEEVIKFLLEKRHIAPSHGSTLYIPDSQNDPLVIRKMPDFFVTGHTHKLSVTNYKGCTIVSCGCWVEMSDYQEKMGMYPDIGKCTVINTKTRKPTIVNFYTERHKRQ